MLMKSLLKQMEPLLDGKELSVEPCFIFKPGIN